MNESHLFTSESVTEGHPDKVADQISDAVVDAIMADDPAGRVACETLVTTGMVFLAGEITTSTYVDLPQLVRNTVREIGYVSSTMGFDADSCAVNVSIDKQSRDIAQGVDTGGAGDQGLMFGYACRETEVLMPLPITMAHRMAQQLAKVRKDDTLGTYLEEWQDELEPLPPLETTLELEGHEGELVPVRLHTQVTETGVLELWCVERDGPHRWKLEFNLREPMD